MHFPRQDHTSLNFGLLGPVRARRDETEIDLGVARQRAVLARLLLAPGQPHETAEIISTIWGESLPGNPRNLVHKYVGGLRRALEPDSGAARDSHLLQLGENGYVMHVDRSQIDVDMFTRAAAEGTALVTSDLAAARARLKTALGLWRGEAFGNLPGDFFAAERRRLAEQRITVTEDRIAVDIMLGQHARAAMELAALLLANPMREHMSVLLMIALCRSGRQAEALQAFQDCRRRLVNELGIEPGREAREVHRQILAGEAVHHITLSSGLEIAPSASTSPAQRAFRPNRSRPGQLAPRNTIGVDIADFTGREVEIDRIGGLLASPTQPTVVVLAGMAGVGKSALAVKVANLLKAHFPDGRIGLNLRGMTADPVEPASALRRLLLQLCVEPPAGAGLDELADQFRDAARGRVLTVFDDVSDERQVRPLLGAQAVLITSRRRLAGLAGAHIIELSPLGIDDSMDMLRRAVGREQVGTSDDRLARRLRELTDGLPLALRIASVRLLARPHWTLTQLLDLLSRPGRQLAELAHNDLDVRACLAATFHQLSPSGRQALLQLGAYNKERFTLSEAVGALQSTELEAFTLIEELVDLQLAHVDEEYSSSRPIYRMRSLVRLFARAEAAGRQGFRNSAPYVLGLPVRRTV